MTLEESMSISFLVFCVFCDLSPFEKMELMKNNKMPAPNAMTQYHKLRSMPRFQNGQMCVVVVVLPAFVLPEWSVR